MIFLNIQIDSGAKLILDKLTAAGFEAYVVGGCVRDAIRGQEASDWDICTSAKPEETRAALISGINGHNIKVIDTGLKFGTVTAVAKKRNYEITTYRSDGEYLDSRRPEHVDFVTSLYEDLARRDFTVNAIAYNELIGLQDPFNGQLDIERRIIRAVGEPDLRFSEDALRIMRALRFSATLGYEIEPETARAAIANMHRLKSVAVERIFTELRKLIMGESAESVLNRFSSVIETAAGSSPALRGQLGGDEAVRFALLFNAASDVLLRLRAPKALIKSAEIIQSTPLPDKRGQALRLIGAIGPEDFTRLICYYKSKDMETGWLEDLAAEAADGELCVRISQLAVNGSQLMDAGVPKGEAVGRALQCLLEKVTDGEVLNDKAALLTLVRRGL